MLRQRVCLRGGVQEHLQNMYVYIVSLDASCISCEKSRRNNNVTHILRTNVNYFIQMLPFDKISGT